MQLDATKAESKKGNWSKEGRKKENFWIQFWDWNELGILSSHKQAITGFFSLF